MSTQFGDAVTEKLELLNNKPFKARKRCRRSAYEEEEREFMQLLPSTPYEPATWRSAKVQNDYTITDGLNRYCFSLSTLYIHPQHFPNQS